MSCLVRELYDYEACHENLRVLHGFFPSVGKLVYCATVVTSVVCTMVVTLITLCTATSILSKLLQWRRCDAAR